MNFVSMQMMIQTKTRETHVVLMKLRRLTTVQDLRTLRNHLLTMGSNRVPLVQGGSSSHHPDFRIQTRRQKRTSAPHPDVRIQTRR